MKLFIREAFAFPAEALKAHGLNRELGFRLIELSRCVFDDAGRVADFFTGLSLLSRTSNRQFEGLVSHHHIGQARTHISISQFAVSICADIAFRGFMQLRRARA